MLDYSGCVLYNWALLDEKGPVDMNNARMLRRFTGEQRRPRELPQNQKRNHPRHREMATSRVDGVKAPPHSGTPRSTPTQV